MRKLESYAELPLEDLNVGRDKIVEFFSDSDSRLTQAIADGAPFAALQPPYQAALANLITSKTATAVNLAQQGAETMTVDNCIQRFKDAVTRFEPKVLVVFTKDSAEYHEFFPQGKQAYSHITRGNVDNLFATIIAASAKYSVQLGGDPAGDFETLQSEYNAARERQLQKKGSTEYTRSAWDDSLDVIKDLAFHNLLHIVDAYRGQPEKVRMFFDQSIITLHKHTDGGDDEGSGAYVLTVPKLESRCADISYSVDDVLSAYVTTDISLWAYGAPTADSPEPETLIELAAGEETELTAAQLGAPTNRFLIIVNKDETTDGEVEIVLL